MLRQPATVGGAATTPARFAAPPCPAEANLEDRRHSRLNLLSRVKSRGAEGRERAPFRTGVLQRKAGSGEGATFVAKFLQTV